MNRFVWEEKPFKHSMGSGFFPEDMYEEMLRNIPLTEEYERYNLYPKRYVIRKLTGFWAEVEKFVKGENENARVVLTRDFPGYSIGPHTDSRKDFANFIFFLTTSEVPGAGTAMFKPKREGFTDQLAKHHPFAGFDLYKQAPFVPNGYFALERSDNSFHGVLPAERVRNTLQMTILR